MLTYEKYARACEKAVNDQDTDELVSLHTDDFRWMTFTKKNRWIGFSRRTCNLFGWPNKRV